MRALRVGTRGSALARQQSGLVAAQLVQAGYAVELVTIGTDGDRRAPDTAWGEGAFVGALERALWDGGIDLAVHSAKDVPLDTSLPIAAYLLRADARDALVCRTPGTALSGLAAGSAIGTDSPRRAGFLRAARPDLRVVPLHGNVDTRLRRLESGEVDALVVAVAGLDRLSLGDRIDEIFEPDILPPAPGQGALAVQVRADAPEGADLAAALDERRVRLEVECERAVLRSAGGGCRAPLGALARLDGGVLQLTAGVVAADGGGRMILERTAQPEQVDQIAEELADAFAAAGYRRAAN